jgi:hypothetical protein
MTPDQLVLLGLGGLVVLMAIVIGVIVLSGRKQPRRPARGRRGANAATDEPQVPAVQPKRPTARGWIGRGAGSSTLVQAPAEWRGTTVQVCGLWPYSIGAGTPMVGVPLGRHIHTGATVCADPISWFQRAKLINNPSVFVMGLPALGKSTLVRRMATGLSGFGSIPFVLGDLKPDYVDVIEALGGQVIRLGRGRGNLNVLDPGESTEAAAKLRAAGFEQEAKEIEADAHGRRLTMVSALLSILRKEPPSDVEESIIDQALRVLDRTIEGRVPVLADLLEVVQQGPTELREVAVDRGDFKVYQEITRGLEASLISLARGGRLGETFAHPTTNPMKRDRPVVYDVSGLKETDVDLRAATLLACWSNGFATVNVANTLAAAGLEPQRHYFVIMDELWQALRSGPGMVDRVDSLTRLNRSYGVGQAMITHTMRDLDSLPTEEERMKARGFVERAGMVIIGGLPQAEMPLLSAAVQVSQAEQELLMGWSAPPSWDPATGTETEPPGRGKFLIKVGGRPGIPLSVKLTETEKSTNDTNKLWHAQSRVGKRALEVVEELIEEREEKVSL